MMKRTPAHLPTPEELLTAPEGPLLTLDLACNKCGDSANHEFEYALVDPKAATDQDNEWDGVFLPRIIECNRCGAVDDYTIKPLSFMTLTTEILRAGSDMSDQGAKAGSRVIVGISELWDGTVARRSSQAIAHLSRLTERHPESGEAWRRLGNAQERFGQPLQAEMSWRKAFEIDPDDLESAYSLAKILAECDQWPEACGFLRKGITLVPSTRDIDPGHRRDLSRGLVNMLKWSLDITDEPIALMAGWSGDTANKAPVITISSVDLRKVKDWDRLAELLVSEDMISAGLTKDLPEEEPTILQRRLAGDWTELPAVIAKSLPPAPVINKNRHRGRNAPCPCGSGKKYKRCCGR